METIFDHNPTEEELVTICGSLGSAERLRNWPFEQAHIGLLVNLMSLRGKKDLVRKYLSMIKDPNERFCTEYGLLKTA